MKKNSFYIERIIPLLITGGLFVHLINISNYLRHGEAHVGDILWPIVDAPLAIMMIYCAVGLFYWKNFFLKFGITSIWRKTGYFVIAFYILASIPGHLRFLSSGDTAYFDFFPWWFSIALMPVYGLMILYFVTLNKVPQGGSDD